MSPPPFTNCKGVDEGAAVFTTLDDSAKRRPPLLQKVRTLGKVRKFLGAEPALSKFGLVARAKKGTTKKRITLDTKEDKIRNATRKKYRVLRPRSIGAVNDALELIARCRTPEEAQDLVTALEAAARENDNLEDVEFLVLDFV